MNRISFQWMLFVIGGLALTSCRTETDRMAEFCIHFVEAVEISQGDCEEMSNRIAALEDSSRAEIRNLDVCRESTACAPCRKAVRTMLAQCGYDSAMQPIFKRFHFSESLRRISESPQDAEVKSQQEGFSE